MVWFLTQSGVCAKWFMGNAALRRDLEAAKAENERNQAILTDPKKLQEETSRLAQRMAEKARPALEEAFAKFKEQQPNTFNLVVGGLVSVGKSTFLNRWFDLHLKTGAGEVTAKIDHVHTFRSTKGKTVQVFDMPGKSWDRNLLDMESLGILGISWVLFLYCDEISSSWPFLDALFKIHQRVILVRTKCDFPDEDYAATIEYDKVKLQARYPTVDRSVFAKIYMVTKVRKQTSEDELLSKFQCLG